MTPANENPAEPKFVVGKWTVVAEKHLRQTGEYDGDWIWFYKTDLILLAEAECRIVIMQRKQWDRVELVAQAAGPKIQKVLIAKRGSRGPVISQVARPNWRR